MSLEGRRVHHGLRKRCTCPPQKWSKCSHSWHLEFKPRGRPRHRLSLDQHAGRRIDSKTEAQRLADEIRRQIRDGTFGQTPNAPLCHPAEAVLTFRAFADIWEAQRGIHLVRPRDNTYRLGTICAFTPPGRQVPFGQLPVVAVTAGDIEAFRDARRAEGWSACTVNHDLKLLRKMFNWGIRTGHFTESPFRRHGLATIRLDTEVPREFRFGHPDDEQRILDACDESPMLRAIIVGYLDTACRVGELLSLQWQDVDLRRREMTIQAAKSKTGTARMIPISSRLLAAMLMRQHDPVGEKFGPDAYVFGDAIGQRVPSIRGLWERIRERAGFPALQLRDLRHEAGSRLDEAGVPLNYVSKILGHTNLATTTRYLNTHRRGLHAAIAKLEAHQAGAGEPAPPTDASESVTQPCHTATGGDTSPCVTDAPEQTH